MIVCQTDIVQTSKAIVYLGQYAVDFPIFHLGVIHLYQEFNVGVMFQSFVMLQNVLVY
jgi:hypothetical protein